MPAPPEGTWILLATFAVALGAGLVPFFSIEAYVLALSAASPSADLVSVALATSLGQMTAKSVVYLAGRGVLKLPMRRAAHGLGAVSKRLAGRRGAMAIVLTSAATSVPPFYVVCLAAGALRLRFGPFFIAGYAGGVARFAALFAVPRLFS